MEYKQFAKYYDKFYQKKNYQREVEFLMHFISNQDKIIDIGCGTGIHASLLEKAGFRIDGLDLNKEMLDTARSRINGKLYNQNVLEMDLTTKYNVIISMFSVLNHLKDVSELEKALLNLKEVLLPNGKIIIDLHNPQNSGKKIDFYNNISRTMIWDFDKDSNIEISNIIYEIDNQQYIDYHIFKIFTIDEVIKCCEKIDLKIISIYENYDIKKPGNNCSKNLQFLIQKQ